MHPIQVDHAGAHGTGPDRFRAVPDDFLMKTLFFKQNDFSGKKKNVFSTKSRPGQPGIDRDLSHELQDGLLV